MAGVDFLCFLPYHSGIAFNNKNKMANEFYDVNLDIHGSTAANKRKPVTIKMPKFQYSDTPGSIVFNGTYGDADYSFFTIKRPSKAQANEIFSWLSQNAGYRKHEQNLYDEDPVGPWAMQLRWCAANGESTILCHDDGEPYGWSYDQLLEPLLHLEIESKDVVILFRLAFDHWFAPNKLDAWNTERRQAEARVRAVLSPEQLEIFESYLNVMIHKPV